MRLKNKEEAQKILAYNLGRIYKLSFNKYPCLYRTLQGDLGKFLRAIINFWMDKELVRTKAKHIVYFINTDRGTKLRNRTTQGVTNRYINYLCAIGLLKKIPQEIERNPKRRCLSRLVIVNRNLLRYNYNDKIRPINVFMLEKYTTEHLLECERRARRLQEKDITTGNISYAMLFFNGLEDIAGQVYFSNRDGAVIRKINELKLLTAIMDLLIESRGYATKQEIYVIMETEYKIPTAETKRLFSIFRHEIWKDRIYKPPSKREKEKHNLNNDKWIILPRGSE